jgi:hypothetical protein
MQRGHIAQNRTIEYTRLQEAFKHKLFQMAGALGGTMHRTEQFTTQGYRHLFIQLVTAQ